jgi:Ca2+-binding RTX toxin-like protein
MFAIRARTAWWQQLNEGDGPFQALDTIPGNINTTEVITAPGTRTSAIDTVGDADFFRVNLVAGQVYSFALNGNGGGSVALANPLLVLRNSAGDIITLDDDSGPGLNALISNFVAATSGVYYLQAVGVGNSTGNYRLETLTTVVNDAVAGGVNTTADLAIGSSVNGVIDVAVDQDWYRITLEAGESYVFTLNASGSPGLSDPYLELRDANGDLIALDDDAGGSWNSLLRFTASEDGVYYINARAHGSETGNYSLSATVGPPQNPLDALDLGIVVPTLNVTVYFAGSGQTHAGVTAIRAWTEAEINSAFRALETYEAITNLTFTQTTSAAGATFVLMIADLDPGVLGQFATISGVGYGAFDPEGQGWNAGGMTSGEYGYVTLLHEFGHGLGLAHPHDNGGGSEIMQGVISPFDSYGTYGLNQGAFTTMSYNDGWNGVLGGDRGNQATPMALDVALLQSLYGANTNTNAGDTVHLMGVGAQFGIYCLWDTGGVDWLELPWGGDAIIDLRAATLLSAPGGGGYVSYIIGQEFGYTIAAGVVIENARGARGDDVLIGNDVANILVGDDGADTLYGALGNDTLDGGVDDDTMTGGLGDDTYVVDNTADVIVEVFGEGVDTVRSSITLTLGDALENLVLVGAVAIDGTGNSSANVITGNDAVNVLFGRAGNDSLSAGLGNDTLWGGDGEDTLNGDTGLDLLDGGNGHDAINGGADADTLYGRAGNDVLNGGAGADNMFGAGGDDTYFVDDAGDVVADIAGGGLDIVHASITYALGQYVENLTLSGLAAIDGVGNILANVIIGNDAANVLSGSAGTDTLSGEAGADTLNGGDGNDTLNGGADNDVLDGGNNEDTLNGGDGADQLFGRTQNDTLNGDAGADTIFGGDGDDVINGGADNDLLDGINGNDTISGGDGADEMYGRQNNDTLNGDAGADTLYGGDGDDVLNGGADDDFLDGSNGIDVLNGGDGADTLYGRNGNDTLDGGLGADTLYGGNDADTFVFSTALGGGNIDTIGAFSVVDDTIQLDVDVFTAIDLGALAANAFVIGAAATDADDRIIYDPVAGALYYDSDGDGAGAAVQFASLAPGLALTNTDFVGGP